MSSFSSNYGVAIVIGGQIAEIRKDGQVTVPFGKEYAIRLINKNNKRAVAKLSIDGQNVSGEGFVINAQSSADIFRPADKAVNFRFASVDSEAAEAHGKAGPDTDGSKGLILVEWRPEKTIPYLGIGYLGALSEKRYDWRCGPEKKRSSLDARPPYDNTYRPSEPTSISRRVNLDDSFTIGYLDSAVPTASVGFEKLSSGVTVEGSVSTQTFQTVSFRPDYTIPITVTSIKLMGYVQAGSTNFCPACQTKTVSYDDKFCRSCGKQF